MVKRYLHLGKRYALSQKEIDDEVEKARKAKENTKEMLKKAHAAKKEWEVKKMNNGELEYVYFG